MKKFLTFPAVGLGLLFTGCSSENLKNNYSHH